MKLKIHQYGKITDIALQKKCEEIFTKEYIVDKDNNKKIIKTKDGFRVYFHKPIFKHAFFRKRKNKEEFDYSRARRVYWIGPIIKEQVPNMEILVKDVKKKSKEYGIKYQRLYFVPLKNYLVVLEWDKSGKKYLKFITHYTGTMEWKKEQIKNLFGI